MFRALTPLIATCFTTCFTAPAPAADSIRGYVRGRSILALVQGVAVSIALFG